MESHNTLTLPSSAIDQPVAIGSATRPRVVLYARKSQEAEDRQVTSLEDQVRVLREYAKKQDLIITHEITEARSAKAPGRPGFQEVLNLINRHKTDAILCWESNRLSRNGVDTGILIDMASEKELVIYTPGRLYRGAQDIMMMYMELGMAHVDNKKRQRDVKRGIQAALARGDWPARAPLGYQNTRTVDGRHRVNPDPKRFPILREAFDCILINGYTVSETLSFVNEERGFRTPRRRRIGGKPLSRNGLYKILSNPFYCGLMLMGGKIHPGRHKPMITVAEFEATQARLNTTPSRRAWHLVSEVTDPDASSESKANLADHGAERPAKKTRTARNFPYTGLMTCATCGCAITASRITNRHGTVYYYYHCTNHRGRKCQCKEPHIRAGALEKQLKGFIERISIPEEIARSLIREVERQGERFDDSVEHAAQGLERSVADTKAAREKLLNLCLVGTVEEAHYQMKDNELAMKEHDLTQRIARLREQPATWIEPSKAAISLLTLAKDRFASADFTERRRLLQIVGSNPQLKDRKLLIQAKKPFSFLVGNGHFPHWQKDVSYYQTVVKNLRKWYMGVDNDVES